jgi:Holliday junction resolvasome RuvABC endonuclease subunit
MRGLGIDPGFRRMGWASVERYQNHPHYHLSGVLHFPPVGKFQDERVQYIEELVPEAELILDLTQPEFVVNETVPAVGSFGGVQMYLANVAVTVMQTMAVARGLPIRQIGANRVQSKIAVGRKGRKTTKPQVRNGVIQLLPELETRRKEWTGKRAIYEEPDAIAVILAELGFEN